MLKDGWLLLVYLEGFSFDLDNSQEIYDLFIGLGWREFRQSHLKINFLKFRTQAVKMIHQ